jgi:hypothetical protein
MPDAELRSYVPCFVYETSGNSPPSRSCVNMSRTSTVIFMAINVARGSPSPLGGCQPRGTRGWCVIRHGFVSVRNRLAVLGRQLYSGAGDLVLCCGSFNMAEGGGCRCTATKRPGNFETICAFFFRPGVSIYAPV